ncbi:MAG: AMP-binding protein [Thaumarchaeota archaeon]|nr:AMP-binding protein [Nitrososphaerota archaeon]
MDMYHLKEAQSLQEIEEEFRWNIPSNYNTAYDACDKYAHDGRIALHHESAKGNKQTYTFNQMKRISDELGAYLKEKGIRPGDRIAVMLPQTPEAAATYLAALKIGAIAVPLSLLYGSESLVTRLVNCEPKVILTNITRAEQIHQKLKTLTSLKLIITVNGSANKLRQLPWGKIEINQWEDQTGTPTKHLSKIKSKKDDPALLIYTAGTSGLPKGVLIPHRAILSRIIAIQLAHYPFPLQNDLYWSPVDWAWIGGLVNSLLVPWILGVPVLSYSRETSFDPAKALEFLEANPVKNCFIPPTALTYFKKHVPRIRSRYKLTVRTMHSGGESLSPELFKWARTEFDVTVNEIYGLTEAGIVIGNCFPLAPVKPGSMGKAIPGHIVATRNMSAEKTIIGIEGLIAIKKNIPSMFLGYWGDPELTQSLFRGDWFIPGDVSTVDSDGYFWFSGRRDIVVKTSGYRVAPLEVEQLLSNHEAVSKCIIVAVPDEERGSILKAYIQLKEEYTPSAELAEEIQQYAKNTAGLHQYPREVEFVDKVQTRLRKRKRKEVV